MQQVLFRISLDSPWCFGPVCLSGFGWGVLLGVWILLGAVWVYRHRSTLRTHKIELIIPGLVWAAVAGVIVKIPDWVHRSTDRQLTRAQAVLKDTVPGSPDYLSAYAQRDRAWRKRRLFAEALKRYKADIRRAPTFAPAYYRLAWIEATAPDAAVRDGRQAVRHAQEAVRLTESRGVKDYHYAASLDALAAAHAEAGRFEKAVETGQQAADVALLSLPPVPGELGYLLPARKRLGRYTAEQAVRDVHAGASVPVYGYGFMMFLGFVAAGWTAMRRGRSVGITAENIWDVCLWVLIGGIGGARLFYVIQDREHVFEDAQSVGDYFFAMINLREGGLVLYGGIVLALTAFLLFCRRRKLSPLLMTDVIMPSFFLGLAFGRLGCFMNGCCYGDSCGLPWAVSFPLGSVPDMALVGRGFVEKGASVTLSLHPSQLYSALNALLLSGLMHYYFRVRSRDGAVLGLALLTYPITRFVIEFLRGDEPGRFQTPLTISQWISMAMFAGALGYVYWLSRREYVLTPLRSSRESDGQTGGGTETTSDSSN